MSHKPAHFLPKILGKATIRYWLPETKISSRKKILGKATIMRSVIFPTHTYTQKFHRLPETEESLIFDFHLQW